MSCNYFSINPNINPLEQTSRSYRDETRNKSTKWKTKVGLIKGSPLAQACVIVLPDPSVVQMTIFVIVSEMSRQTRETCFCWNEKSKKQPTKYEPSVRESIAFTFWDSYLAARSVQGYHSPSFLVHTFLGFGYDNYKTHICVVYLLVSYSFVRLSGQHHFLWQPFSYQDHHL